jgi:hypothetical protein
MENPVPERSRSSRSDLEEQALFRKFQGETRPLPLVNADGRHADGSESD